MNSKRWVTLIVAAALGGGLSVAVGSCGGEDRGSVEVESSTAGAETSTTGGETSTAGEKTTTSGAGTTTAP